MQVEFERRVDFQNQILIHFFNHLSSYAFQAEGQTSSKPRASQPHPVAVLQPREHDGVRGGVLASTRARHGLVLDQPAPLLLRLELRQAPLARRFPFIRQIVLVQLAAEAIENTYIPQVKAFDLSENVSVCVNRRGPGSVLCTSTLCECGVNVM